MVPPSARNLHPCMEIAEFTRRPEIMSSTVARVIDLVKNLWVYLKNGEYLLVFLDSHFFDNDNVYRVTNHLLEYFILQFAEAEKAQLHAAVITQYLFTTVMYSICNSSGADTHEKYISCDTQGCIECLEQWTCRQCGKTVCAGNIMKLESVMTAMISVHSFSFSNTYDSSEFAVCLMCRGCSGGMFKEKSL